MTYDPNHRKDERHQTEEGLYLVGATKSAQPTHLLYVLDEKLFTVDADSVVVFEKDSTEAKPIFQINYQFTELSSAGDYLFIATINEETISRYSLKQAQRETLATKQPRVTEVRGIGEQVFWTSQPFVETRHGPIQKTSFMRWKNKQVTCILEPETGFGYGLAVGPEHIYWIEDRGERTMLMQCTHQGASQKELFMIGPRRVFGKYLILPTIIQVTSNFVYWRNASDEIWRGSLLGQNEERAFYNQKEIQAYAVDEAGLFVLVGSAQDPTWELLEVLPDGPRQLVSFASKPTMPRLALDAENVYWNRREHIFMVPRSVKAPAKQEPPPPKNPWWKLW